jgi:hypothetical protein
MNKALPNLYIPVESLLLSHSQREVIATHSFTIKAQEGYIHQEFTCSNHLLLEPRLDSMAPLQGID